MKLLFAMQMILNEDYFNDIEISEDDIDKQSYEDEHILSAPDCNTLKQYLQKNGYSRSMCLSIRNDTDDDIALFWRVGVSGVLKKTAYFLNLYGIEDYRILLQGSRSIYRSRDVAFFEIEGYPVLVDTHDITDGQPTWVNVIFYVKFPDFSYRQSYCFINRMMNMLSYYDSFCSSLTIISMSIYTEYVLLTPYIIISGREYDLDFSEFVKEEYEDIHSGLPYKMFFYQALKCFNNSRKDEDVIEDMLENIKQGCDPFRKD